MNLLDRTLTRIIQWRTQRAMTSLPAPPGFGGNSLPPLSHGNIVHEPFAGAWQQNKECFGGGGIFSAVYACIAIISGDLAKLPPRVRSQKPDGSKVDLPNHPAALVLNNPNNYQTRVDFWGQFMASALFTGNVYVFLQRDDTNVIRSMHVLDPRLVSVLLADDGSVFYRIGQERLAQLLKSDVIPARDMMHHRLLSLTHPLMGLTPLYAAGVSAMTGQTIQQNSYSFFANMSRASGVLTSPGKISQELANRLKTEWDQNFKGGQMGRTAVLGEGMKWEPLTISAADAQLIEQLRWSVEDVARCFRVPTYMLTDASKVSFKNAETLARNYYSQTLQYHIESIEARVDQAFNLTGNTFCEFDLAAMLRMELDARMAAYQTGIQSGVLTINEARKLEELAPKEGGDEPLVQAQYRPLSMAGQPANVTAPPAEPPAPPDDPAADDANAEDLADEELNALRLRVMVRARAHLRLAA